MYQWHMFCVSEQGRGVDRIVDRTGTRRTRIESTITDSRTTTDETKETKENR